MSSGKLPSSAATVGICVALATGGFLVASSRSEHGRAGTRPVYRTYDPYHREPTVVGVGAAVLTVQPGALTHSARVMIDTDDPADGPPPPAGLRDLTDHVLADFRSKGRPAERLEPPLQLTIAVPGDEELIVSYFTFTVDRSGWIDIPRIGGQTANVPSLPETHPNGYWIEGKGKARRVQILTHRLARFTVFGKA